MPSATSRSVAALFSVAFLCCSVTGRAPLYRPLNWNKSCNYTFGKVPSTYFFSPASSPQGALLPLKPLKSNPGSMNGSVGAPQLCFNASEPYNDTLVAAGSKLPCGYAIQPGGSTVSYWEEAACPETLLTNCYCYALDRFVRGYCMPGLRDINDQVAVADCQEIVEAIKADGGTPVTRQAVYSTPAPAEGHYVAAAVWPRSDFHFWRLDAGGAWSGKRGDTFVTNTHPNSTLVTDVEDPAALGLYTQFCGYFLVNPKNVTLVPTGFSAQGVPYKVEQAKRSGLTVTIQPLAHPSWGWARQNYNYLLFGLDAAMWESGDRPLSWGYKGAAQQYGSTRQLKSTANSTGTAGSSTSSSSPTSHRTLSSGTGSNRLYVIHGHKGPAAAAAAVAGPSVASHDPEPMWLSRIRWHLQLPVTPIDWSAA